MAPVKLLDRDGEPKPAAAGLMRPHAFDLRDARGLQLIPHRAGAVGAAIEGIIVGRHAGNPPHQNGILPGHEGFEWDAGLFLQPAGVIAGPFAERPFGDQITRMHEAFEGDFGVGGNGKAGARPAITSTGSPSNPPAASYSFLP